MSAGWVNMKKLYLCTDKCTIILNHIINCMDIKTCIFKLIINSFAFGLR